MRLMEIWLVPMCNKASEALVHEISDRSKRLVTNRSLLFASQEQKSRIKHPSTWNASLCAWWRIWVVPDGFTAVGVVVYGRDDKLSVLETHGSIDLRVRSRNRS